MVDMVNNGKFARPLARGVLDNLARGFLLIDSPPLNPLPRGLLGPVEGGGKLLLPLSQATFIDIIILSRFKMPLRCQLKPNMAPT